MIKILLDSILKLKNESSIGITFIGGNNDDELMSYAKLYELSLKRLGALQKLGMEVGNVAVFQLNSNKEFIISFWACVLGGIIPVIAPLAYDEEHRLSLFKIFKEFKKPYLVTTNELFSLVNESKLNETDVYKEDLEKIIFTGELDESVGYGNITDAKEEDIVLIQFSSGSTGDPKGVTLSNKNLITNIQAIIKAANVTKSDSAASWMPLTHNIGLIGLHITALFVNVNQSIMPTQEFIRNPISWLLNVSKIKATITASPNFGFKYILNNYDELNFKGIDLSKVRLIFNGAEPISVELCDAFISVMNKHGLKKNVLFPVYGMAEATLAISFPLPGENLRTVIIERDGIGIGKRIKYGANQNDRSIAFVSVGYPVEGCDIRIADDDDNLLEEGIIGNIQIRGENVTHGYYNNKVSISECFTKDKWFKTGDMGFLEDDRLVVTGRKKDIIFIGGKNYYPVDIEKIIGRESEFGSQDIVAISSFNKKEQVEDIIIFIKYVEELHNFNKIANTIKQNVLEKFHIIVKHVIPVNDIPKTNSGKVERYKLARNYENNIYNHLIEELESPNNIIEANLALSDTEKKLVEICKEVLAMNMGINENFISLGVNSISMTKIQEKIQKYFPEKISIANLYSYPTISQLAKFIDNNREISHSYVKMPKDIFNFTNNEKETVMFRYEISGEILENINKYTEVFKNDTETILLSAYVYLLHKISKQNEISVEAITKNEGIITQVNINFDSIDDFCELTSDIEKQCSELLSNSYSIENIDNLKISNKECLMNSLFYLKEKISTEIDVANYYDLSVSLEKYTDLITMTFIFNKKKIKEDAIKMIINLYKKLIQAVTEETLQKVNN